jgi:CTP synthase (UTP-ammonia lyase)
MPARIALVGDYDPAVVAHCAIDKCFALANQAGKLSLAPVWVPTDQIIPGDANFFAAFDGIWCVPASPYRNTDGALWAIQYARTKPLPFLGSCGGFQHALLEFARNVLGLKEAAHAELTPDAALLLLDRMRCSLVEKSQTITIIPGSGFEQIFGGSSGIEGFHCSYGLNPKFEHLLDGSALEIVARSEDGEARAFLLRGHPFFVGTLFQPERRALSGQLHPVVAAFFAACGQPRSVTDANAKHAAR